MVKRLLFTLFLLFTALPTFAQSSDETFILGGYFIAADENGILQVWQLAEDGGEATPITDASGSIADYDVSSDGTQIAYTSGQKLWLQTPDKVIEIAAISEGGRVSSPVFNEDGTQLAYNNGGLNMYDIAAGESRLLQEDTPYVQEMPSVEPVRYYFPLQFVNDKLIVRVSLWEGLNVGVYDLESGELEELADFGHTNLRVLSDGRVIVYGNTELQGEFNLEIADGLEDINDTDLLLDLETLSPSAPLFVDEVIEIAPGIVRVMGSTYNLEGSTNLPLFYFDFDVATGELSAVGVSGYSYVSSDENIQTWLGTPSPNGQIMPQYMNMEVATDLNSNGIIFGQLAFTDLLTGETMMPNFTGKVASFQWAE